jgi:hypothetical protein
MSLIAADTFLLFQLHLQPADLLKQLRLLDRPVLLLIALLVAAEYPVAVSSSCRFHLLNWIGWMV